MKLSATPQPRVSYKRSEDISTDMHSMCYSRVSLLTNEVEKLSDVLCATSQEVDVLRNTNQELNKQCAQGEQAYQILNQEFEDVCEKLKTRTIEAEEYAFRLQKLQLLNTDLKQQVHKLCAEVETLSGIVSGKEQDLVTARSQFISKTEELSQTYQQLYHVEGALKLVKEEKLKYIHEYQVLEKKLAEAEAQVQLLLPWKAECEQLKVDIDVVRRNYTDLLEQRAQEKQASDTQMDVLRQMSAFSLEDAQNKYMMFVEQEITRATADLEKQYRLQIINHESEIDRLRNLLSAQQLEKQNLELKLQSMQQTQNLHMKHENMERDQHIRELMAQNQALEEQYYRVNLELEQWQQKLAAGEIIKYDKEFQKQIDSFFEINRLKQELELENQNLKKEVRHLSENIALFKQLQGQQGPANFTHFMNTNNNTTLLLSQIAPAQQQPTASAQNSRVQDGEKIRMLLKAVEDLQGMVKEKDHEIMKLSQMTQFKPTRQSAVFYHVNSTEFSQILK